MRLSLMSLALVAALGCGEKEAAPGKPTEGGADLSAVVERVGDASAFETTAAKPYAALSCVRGLVEELDVLVCHYPDVGSADAATKSLNEFVAGALTGIVRKSGSDLIAIADRKEVDPKGERISRIAKAFVVAP